MSVYEGQIVGPRKNPSVVIFADEDFCYWIASRLPHDDLMLKDLHEWAVTLHDLKEARR